MNNYITFLRSARNFREFGSAQKIIQETGLSLEQAKEDCANFKANRTESQIEAGTLMEFTNDFDYLSDAIKEDGTPFMG